MVQTAHEPGVELAMLAALTTKEPIDLRREQEALPARYIARPEKRLKQDPSRADMERRA